MEPQVLDARGLICPLPVLRAQKLLRTLAPGTVLEILASDPGALADFPRFCDATGHRLLACDPLEPGGGEAGDQAGGAGWRFRIEKGGG